MLKLFIVSWLIVDAIGKNKVPYFRKDRNVKISPHRDHVKEPNGTYIKSDDYRFIALHVWLTEKGMRKSACTSSIIAPQWALTSGLCSFKFKRPDQQLHLWYKNFTQSPLETKYMSKVLEHFVHPSFPFKRPMIKKMKHMMLRNNIGLLRIQPINILKYGKVAAPDYMSLIGLGVTFAGGAKLSLNAVLHVYRNMFVPIQIGSGTICMCNDVKKYKFHMPLICVAAVVCSHKNTIHSYAHYGSPLIHNGKIYGVLSIQQFPKTYKFGFTPVSPYLGWIQRTVQRKW